MGRWTLQDLEGNQKNIPDKIFKFLEAEFKAESDFIEKSNRDGADKIGLDRIESRELPFIFQSWETNETSFRENLNELFYWFRKTVYVIDTVNKQRAKVSITSQSLKYLQGTFNKYSDNQVNFKMLNPYWESTEEFIENLSAISSGEIVVINRGWAATPPKFDILAIEACTKFSIIVEETLEGIAVNDLQFGSLGLNEYEIDCDEGTSELNGNDRSEFIRPGTGFFNLEVGRNTLLISSNGAIDISVRYRELRWL